jgi:predicted XRE-type DNA-binding protein
MAGSGNVFADLKLPHADDLLAKAELAGKIIVEIERRRLTQTQAAAILGMDQPKVSALKQGSSRAFRLNGCCAFWCCWDAISKSGPARRVMRDPRRG